MANSSEPDLTTDYLGEPLTVQDALAYVELACRELRHVVDGTPWDRVAVHAALGALAIANAVLTKHHDCPLCAAKRAAQARRSDEWIGGSHEAYIAAIEDDDALGGHD